MAAQKKKTGGPKKKGQKRSGGGGSRPRSNGASAVSITEGLPNDEELEAESRLIAERGDAGVKS